MHRATTYYGVYHAMTLERQTTNVVEDVTKGQKPGARCQQGNDCEHSPQLGSGALALPRSAAGTRNNQ